MIDIHVHFIVCIRTAQNVKTSCNITIIPGCSVFVKWFMISPEKGGSLFNE